ncbi:unnamed protein product [Prunus armeniaca]
MAAGVSASSSTQKCSKTKTVCGGDEFLGAAKLPFYWLTADLSKENKCCMAEITAVNLWIRRFVFHIFESHLSQSRRRRNDYVMWVSPTWEMYWARLKKLNSFDIYMLVP